MSAKKSNKIIDFFAGPSDTKIVPKEYAEWIGDNKYRELIDTYKGDAARSYIRTAYRKSSIIGDGGAADARRFEIETGINLGRDGKSHEKKIEDLIRQLKKAQKVQMSDKERLYLENELRKLEELQG